MVEEVGRLVEDGHFAEAVRAALQRFEFEVQERSGWQALGGKDLMAQVFNVADPLLRITSSRRGRSTGQEGYAFLTMGAMLAFRNEYSHGAKVDLSSAEAMEQLSFVSFLFRWLDAAQEVRKSKEDEQEGESGA